MTDPKWARATENGRHYVDPQGGPMLPSVTNAIGQGCGLKTAALVGWSAKVTAEYAWEVLPRMVAALRHPEQQELLTKEIKARRLTVLATAQDLGTRVHKHADAHVTGKPLPEDPEVVPYLGQYLAWAKDFDVDLNLHVEGAEATVFNRRAGYAGTLDLLVWLPLDGVTASSTGLPVVKPTEDGSRRLWLVDLKTSATRPASATYPDQRLQLAGLRFAESLLLPDDTEMPMPKVAGCAILNLRTSSYGFIPQVVGQAEHKAFLCAVGMTTWATARGADPKPITATGATRKGRTPAPAPVTPPPASKPARVRTQIRTRTRSVA